MSNLQSDSRTSWSMIRTLERYQKCKYGPQEPNVPSRDEALAVELSSLQEYLKLKERYDALLRTQRNLLGEDLGPLSTKELESLERRLDSSLKKIRALRVPGAARSWNESRTKCE
uniref:K-box domain-containing protein n=1 Tax=Brassica oleracea var. oleracea TaxID=109376 RepID=A0A0D3D6H8_BRAOL